ncbi:hypothetical protein D3C87_2062200 [compost metagenome]
MASHNDGLIRRIAPASAIARIVRVLGGVSACIGFCIAGRTADAKISMSRMEIPVIFFKVIRVV